MYASCKEYRKEGPGIVMHAFNYLSLETKNKPLLLKKRETFYIDNIYSGPIYSQDLLT